MAREGHGPKPQHGPRPDAGSGDRTPHGDTSGRGGIKPPEQQTREDTQKAQDRTQRDTQQAQDQTTQSGSHSQGGGSGAGGGPSVGGSTSGGFGSTSNRINTEDGDPIDPFYDFGPQEPSDYTSSFSENGADNSTPSVGEGVVDIILCVNGEPFNAYFSGAITGKVS